MPHPSPTEANYWTCNQTIVVNAGFQLPADPVDYKIQICLGHHWWWQTGTVVQPSSGDSLTFQFNEYGGINATTTSPSAPAENYFFLEGEGELDFPGESWLDSSGSLSLWTPEGDSPANHLVRV